MSELKVIEFPKQEAVEPTIEAVLQPLKDFIGAQGRIPDVIVIASYDCTSGAMAQHGFRTRDEASFDSLQRIGMFELMKTTAIQESFAPPIDVEMDE